MTAIERAVEALCLEGLMHDNDMLRKDRDMAVAIIKRELEKAVPARPVAIRVLTLDEALTKARHEAINECRKQIGLGGEG